MTTEASPKSPVTLTEYIGSIVDYAEDLRKRHIYFLIASIA
jgi:hypothetical protein